MRGAFAGGEFGQGVGGEGEGGEEVVRFGEEGRDGAGGEGVRDEEVAVFLVGCELLGGEIGRWGAAFWWRGHA